LEDLGQLIPAVWATLGNKDIQMDGYNVEHHYVQTMFYMFYPYHEWKYYEFRPSIEHICLVSLPYEKDIFGTRPKLKMIHPQSRDISMLCELNATPEGPGKPARMFIFYLKKGCHRSHSRGLYTHHQDFPFFR